MVEALLLGLVAFIAQSEYALGTSLISRPIVTGLLTGLVLGDVQTGVIMGATLELAFIGSFSVGASIPPDVVTGGILGGRSPSPPARARKRRCCSACLSPP
ncbi:hypothetical protein NUKP76_18220 [Klebsiella variicola]|nr:hypothetical protein NUKP76_18220 [Klebsiella variicola]